MALGFDEWVRSEVEERDLTGYARERVEEEMMADETLTALWRAMYQSDSRQGHLRTLGRGQSPRDLLGSLTAARRACDTALDELADHIIEETCQTEVGGHSVNLRHATRLDQCPACEEERVEAYYLGSYGEMAAWVCGHCEADVEEWPDGLTVAEE